jgi:hypothetical protein
MEERGTRSDSPMKSQLVTWELAKRLREDAIVSCDSLIWLTYAFTRCDKSYKDDPFFLNAASWLGFDRPSQTGLEQGVSSNN